MELLLKRTIKTDLSAIGICAAVEIWSRFMENLPKAGYDIVGAVCGLFTGILKLKTEF